MEFAVNFCFPRKSRCDQFAEALEQCVVSGLTAVHTNDENAVKIYTRLQVDLAIPRDVTSRRGYGEKGERVRVVRGHNMDQRARTNARKFPLISPFRCNARLNEECSVGGIRLFLTHKCRGHSRIADCLKIVS